ncbi:hypothetical protein OW763_10405 [Clostridium aestuarii]|uniref:DUF5673 domain-containing protein n=1 Tax=Clostridium aestuarii TaxID=338193 RepID=A0ABT4D0X8_9CLOT|nr:hypothetical protein [Clostridium aestuarii]MCY6484752.1 hypothetical protein [Clostridium aestuarii]
MEEDNKKIKEKKCIIDVIDNIINALIIVSIFILFLNISGNINNKITFAAFVVIFSSGIFLKPLKDGISKRKERFLSTFEVLILVLQGMIVVSFIFCLYLVMFSNNLELRKYYYLCMGTFSIIIAILVGKGIANFIKSIEDVRKENADSSKYLKIVFKGLFTLAVCVILPLYQLYEPKEIIELSNLEKPYKLEITKVKREFDTNDLRNLSKSSEHIGCITDKKIINDFHESISNLRIENIRYLENFNYEIRKEKNYPYYEITPIYKTLDGPAFGKSIKDGYIYEIKFYEDGEMIINSRNLNRKFLKNNYVKRFELPVSDKIVKEVRNVIENLK